MPTVVITNTAELIRNLSFHLIPLFNFVLAFAGIKYFFLFRLKPIPITRVPYFLLTLQLLIPPVRISKRSPTAPPATKPAEYISSYKPLYEKKKFIEFAKLL